MQSKKKSKKFQSCCKFLRALTAFKSFQEWLDCSFFDHAFCSPATYSERLKKKCVMPLILHQVHSVGGALHPSRSLLM